MKTPIKRGLVAPDAWFPVHSVLPGRARGYARLMARGRDFAPVVVVDYEGQAMPLDGHHRLTAAGMLSRPFPAWCIDGEWFEAICERRRRDGRPEPDSILVRLAERLEQGLRA